MIRYLLALWIVVLLAVNGVNAQNFENKDFAITVTERFQQFSKVPYEKLYLHLDKPYYSAGESIWYAAYLIDGMHSIYSPYSKFIYVELINKSDSVVMRYKLVQDSLGFAANIPIPSTFPGGDYHLRAYSRWMQNSGSDYFFRKNIHIGNEIDKSIQTKITYVAGDDPKQITADIAFSSDDKLVFAKREIEYRIFEGNILKRTQKTTIDNGGHLKFGFQVNAQSKEQYRIQVVIDDDKLNYKNTFFVPKPDRGFDCQFFPEGGSLLNNGIRNVAFKAIGENGYSVEIAGTVYNEKGDSITSFASQHKGMGSFPLLLYNNTPAKYHAKVHVAGESKEREFMLPEVKESGVGITLFALKDRIIYRVIAADKLRQANRKFYLLAQQNGNLQAILPLTDTLKWEGSIRAEKLRRGIVHFVLTDESGNALSERLAFVNNLPQSALDVKPDKNVYALRTPVTLNISMKNDQDSLIQGRFSVSVTDDQAVKTDSLGSNIFSELLLTSDLKGFIEEPGYYFNTPDRVKSSHLDLVMLTHGWTRFDVQSVIAGKQDSIIFPVEQRQSFSGKVSTLTGKPAANAQLVVLEAKNKLFRALSADAKGEFKLDGLVFPDSTTFLIQALSKKGHDTVELLMNPEPFPAVQSTLPFRMDSVNHAEDEYMKIMSQKYHYEGGERVYHLKEVTVTANRKPQVQDNLLYAGLGHPVRTEDIDKLYSGKSVLDIVGDFPGVMVSSDKISVRGSSVNPKLYIDDIPYPDDQDIVQILSYLSASQVAYVNLLKGPETVLFGSGASNGVILVNLKKGEDLNTYEPSLGLSIYHPLGYYKPSRFYAPKYETPEQIKNPNPDLRTTIYWNPAVTLDPHHSSALSFYTADRPGSYTVTVEGMTIAGEPLRYQTKLNVKEP